MPSPVKTWPLTTRWIPRQLMPTKPSILSRSGNEYQLKLGLIRVVTRVPQLKYPPTSGIVFRRVSAKAYRQVTSWKSSMDVFVPCWFAINRKGLFLTQSIVPYGIWLAQQFNNCPLIVTVDTDKPRPGTNMSLSRGVVYSHWHLVIIPVGMWLFN